MIRKGVDCYCPNGKESKGTGKGKGKEVKGAWPVKNGSCMLFSGMTKHLSRGVFSFLFDHL